MKRTESVEGKKARRGELRRRRRRENSPSLTGLTELASDNTSNSLVEIGIVKYDERCVSTQLERELLQSRGRLTHQDFSNSSRSSERDFVDERVLAHLLADVGSVLRSRYDVDNSIRNTGLPADISHSEDRVRSFGRSFELQQGESDVSFQNLSARFRGN